MGPQSGLESCCSILNARNGHGHLRIRIRGDGGVAQLGEHLPCKQGVRGSNPLISTKEAADGPIAQQARARA